MKSLNHIFQCFHLLIQINSIQLTHNFFLNRYILTRILEKIKFVDDILTPIFYYLITNENTKNLPYPYIYYKP